MSRPTTINLGRAPIESPCVLGDDERAAIQLAYGNAFSDEIWKEILYVTSELTVWEPIAQNSASFKETLKTLHKLAELARSLRHDIAPQRTHLGDFTLEEMWYAFFFARKRPPKVDDFFVFLLEILDPLIAMDDFAAKHEKDDGQSVTLPKGPYKGFYWEYWISALTQLFGRHGLPVAARKDTDKKTYDEQSPFVLFVFEFQKYLPEQCRKFTNSLDALAQAIHRARDSYESEMGSESREIFAEADRLIEEGKRRKRAELARLADARTWRLRDTRAALRATLNPRLSRAKRAAVDEKMELCLASNEAVDLLRKGKIEAAEQDARKLLTRFPDAHDGYDRLGMVHEARGDKRQAAECYRKVIEVIRRHPDDFESGFEEIFAELVNRLDPPANRASIITDNVG